MPSFGEKIPKHFAVPRFMPVGKLGLVSPSRGLWEISVFISCF